MTTPPPTPLTATPPQAAGDSRQPAPGGASDLRNQETTATPSQAAGDSRRRRILDFVFSTFFVAAIFYGGVLFNKVQTAQAKIDDQQKRIDTLERDIGACKEVHPYLQKEIDKAGVALIDSRHAFDAFRCEILHQKFDNGTLTCTGVPLP